MYIIQNYYRRDAVGKAYAFLRYRVANSGRLALVSC